MVDTDDDLFSSRKKWRLIGPVNFQTQHVNNSDSIILRKKTEHAYVRHYFDIFSSDN